MEKSTLSLTEDELLFLCRRSEGWTYGEDTAENRAVQGLRYKLRALALRPLHRGGLLEIDIGGGTDIDPEGRTGD